MKPKDDAEAPETEAKDDDALAAKNGGAPEATDGEPSDAEEGGATGAADEDDAGEAKAADTHEAAAADTHDAEAEKPAGGGSRSPVRPDFDLREQSVLVSAPPVDAELDGGGEPDDGLSGAARFLRGLGPRLLGLILILLVGAGGVGTVLTLVHPFRDWFMHLAMYAVIFSFFLLYLKAHARRRSITRYLMMLVTGVLCGFFAWILADYVPSRMVLVGARPVPREDLPLLYLPVGLLLCAILLLLFHCVVAARYAKPTAD